MSRLWDLDATDWGMAVGESEAGVYEHATRGHFPWMVREHLADLSCSHFSMRPGACSVYVTIHDDGEPNHSWTLVPAPLIEGWP